MKLRTMRWAEHVARMGQTSNTDTVFTVKTGQKRQLRRASPRWDNEIGGYFEKWKCVD